MEAEHIRYKWKRIEPNGTIPAPRSGHTSVQSKGTMYIFGGFSGSKCFNDLYSLDLSTYVINCYQNRHGSN